MTDALYMKYFVLKPEGRDTYAKASRTAMFRYALFIREENPEMARQIWNWAGLELAKAHCEDEEQPPEIWAPPPREEQKHD